MKIQTNLFVREVMSHGCRFCADTDQISSVARMMRDEDLGALPVARDDKLVGFVTDRDITVRGLADGEDAARMTAGDLMSQQVYYCYTDQRCDDVASNMASMQVRRMPVVTRDKELVGMISIGDLARHDALTAALEALHGVSR